MRIVHSPSELATLLDMNAPQGLIEPTFDAKAWLNSEGNLALRVGNDLGMFEYLRPRDYIGHVWVNSRGAQALETAHDMLSYMFTRGGAESIFGETPTDRRDAWLFVRKLGFRRLGTALREHCGRKHSVTLSRLKAEWLPQ